MIRKDAWYNFNFPKFTKAHVVAQYAVSFWRVFHVHLRIMYILLLLCRMLYKYQLRSSGLMHLLRSTFPYSFSVWMICPLMKMGCYSHYYYCVSIDFSLMAFSICLLNCHAPMVDTYIFTAVISSSWIIDLMIIM